MASAVLDRILQQLARDGRLPESPDAEVLARSIEEHHGEEWDEYERALKRLDVQRFRPEDARQLAEALLDGAEAEVRRIKRELPIVEEQAARAGLTGPAMQAVRRLRAELVELNEISLALFGAVHPPSLRGQGGRDHGVRPSTVTCRTCSNKIPRLEAFNARPLGLCSDCRAELARPTNERTWLDELVDRL